MTGEEAAAQLSALLKPDGTLAAAINLADAWDLPRRHTERLVTAGFAD